MKDDKSKINPTDILNKNIEETSIIKDKINQAIFEYNKDSIIVFKLEKDGKWGNFIEANSAAINLFGYSKKEFLLLNFKDLENVSDKKIKSRMELMQSNGKINFETVIKTKKGLLRNVEIENILLNYLDEPAVMSIIRDITERKQMENNVKKANESLITILEAIPDLLFEVGIDGMIYHYQSHRDDLLAVPLSEFVGKLFQEVLPTDVTNVIRKAIQEANEKGWSTGHQYALDLPKGKFWFELSVSPINGDSNKNKHFIILARDITDRKKSELALQKSQEKLRGIFDLANSGIILTDLRGKYLLFNNWLAEKLGYTRAEMNKLTRDDIIHPDDIEKSDLMFNKIINGKVDRYQLEKRYLKKDKTYFWGEISISAIKDKNNKVVNTVGIINDITEKKLAEEYLLESKRFAYATLDALSAHIAILDENGYIIAVNVAWRNFRESNNPIGLDLKPIEGQNYLSVCENSNGPGAEEGQEMAVGIYSVMNGEQDEFSLEYPCHSPTEKRWFNARVTRFLGKGDLRIVVAHENITERKLVEEKLIANEKFLNQTQTIAKIGSYALDFKSGKWTGSPVLDIVFGIDKNYDRSIEGWQSLIHPEWRSIMVDYLNNEVIGKRENFNKEYKIINAYTNEDSWVHGLGEVIYNEKNEPLQLIGTIQDVTDQKNAEGKLRESEEKYRGLVEGSPDGIVLYSDDKIVFINDEGLRIMGAKNRSELIGKPILQYVHPESKNSIIQRMKEVISNELASASVEEKFVDIEGNPIDVEIKAIPTIYEHKVAVQVIVHDITERKRTQEKIRQLSQAVEQSPVSIVITNTKGEIEYANPKFTETTGYSLNEVIGQNPRFLKSGQTTPEEYKELWQTIAAGKEWHGEFENKKKNGELYWESASISPIVNAQGQSTHYIAIKEDITHRKNIDLELIKAKNKAEESDRLKLAFLANMSHEIRTPMNGILGFTELLKEPKLTGEEQQEYIKIIEKSGKRMLNIINDIISISKVESGQIEVSLKETNINEQIEYLNTFFKPETKQKGIKLIVTEKLSPKECVISTDKEKIYAVLTNLIKNAIKFTDSGSIKFGCERKGENVKFFVKDSGLGIPKSQQKIIFERFRQANETITRAHEGSGLGLAISKAYVEMLGGKIWVESKVGKGSTFYFTIPYKDGYETENEENIAHPEVTEENKIKDLKILIVEDDAISKLLITIAVKPYSKEILKVSTGIEAIEACRNNPDIDLVMMDINMPEMGGYEATKQIREFNKDLVIIAQTANGMQSDRDNAIAAGCTDYISKPVNITSLGQLIQKYFRKNKEI